ncbi:tRNA (cytosine(72)-C(5))-methyltransferase NSUN6-like [Watersipora subatra]|uniref:tRNA (cytosine(72)-C(5))-methyltransferase NSUN6-like n=1 Tax=Watersipora subatra TaxID=2589382 RepID=UPI00355C74D3
MASFCFLNDKTVKKFEKLDIYKKLQQVLAVPPAYTTLRVNILNGDPRQVIESVRKELSERHPTVEFDVRLHPVITDLLVISSINHGPIPREQLEKEVVVDRFCGAAVLRGADVFASGLLVMSPNIHEGDKVSVYMDTFGKFLRGSLPPYTFPRVHIANGISMYSRHKVFSGMASLSGVGINITEPLYTAPKLNNFLPNLLFAQNLPSSLVAHILGPKAGETVLDMCAAPGGKTVHLGNLMQATGTLIAIDKAKKKMDVLKNNLSASGCHFAQAFCYDSAKLVCEEYGDSQTLANGPPYPAGSFDKILLDAPCSALGQRPSFSNHITCKELGSYPSLQRKLLSSAVSLLKEGGTLVYSTCTFTSEENELQVSWLLSHYKEMHLLPQGEFHLNKHSNVRAVYPDCTLTDQQLSLLQSFHPAFLPADKSALNYDNDTIGFFIAKFEKVSS